MQPTTKNFKIENVTLKPLKILGLRKNVKTNGYDSFGELDPKVSSQTASKSASSVLQGRSYQGRTDSEKNIEDDPRLSSYSRNNFNPDMLKTPQSTPNKAQSSPRQEEISEEMRSQINENMDFLKNMLKLYQAVKGPMKKQILVLQDYEDEHYHKMVFGFQVDSFENISDEFVKLEVPEGEYFSLTLASNNSPDQIKEAWKYLKEELSDQRSFAFDFQITDPIKKTITFFAAIA